MFINFWYAVDFSDRITDQPSKARMLGHDFVVFRDSAGQAHCLSDTCVHRGAALSGGKRRGDCVQCPYHGWQFDAEGRCRSIPSLGPGHKVPPRARIDAYPTVERYGLVFAFLGDLPEAERPPIMAVPEFQQEGWRATNLDYWWEANYQRIIENGLDPAHNEFVHPTHGSSGENPEHRVGELPLEQHEWGWGFMHKYQGSTTRSFLTRFNEKKKTPPEAGTSHFGPNQMATYIHINETKWLHQYIFETPVDEFHTHGFLVNMRNFVLSPWVDRAVSKRNMAVAEQDRVVVERMQPQRAPRRNVKEMHMPADKIIRLYREKILEWEAKGWRIDLDALAAKRAAGDFVTVIPSPGRRDSRNWVLDPVPLIAPAKPEQASDVA